jgi:hypothetical protein
LVGNKKAAFLDSLFLKKITHLTQEKINPFSFYLFSLLVGGMVVAI